jgi:hypothetical protein
MYESVWSILGKISKIENQNIISILCISMLSHNILQPTNSVALVRERTIPTERPPLVGEVSANCCG